MILSFEQCYKMHLAVGTFREWLFPSVILWRLIPAAEGKAAVFLLRGSGRAAPGQVPCSPWEPCGGCVSPLSFSITLAAVQPALCFSGERKGVVWALAMAGGLGLAPCLCLPGGWECGEAPLGSGAPPSLWSRGRFTADCRPAVLPCLLFDRGPPTS